MPQVPGSYVLKSYSKINLNQLRFSQDMGLE